MKNYNKILEAINRGINLALDDFNDDEEQIQNIKSKQINHRDYTKEYLDLIEEVVDLGLPSGTLWCKYNLGVNPNQLLTPEDWYGDYYAWGEIEDKSKQGKEYNWKTYKFGKNEYNLTKYCNNPKYGLKGFTDNLTELVPEDDAAYQNKKFYNYKFHIPSKEQFEELIKYTKIHQVKNYDPNKTIHNQKDDDGIQGLNGKVFEGKNGNQLFIPAAGYRGSSNVYNAGNRCQLQTSTLYSKDPRYNYHVYFNTNIVLVYDVYRYFGYSIRPVINL